MRSLVICLVVMLGSVAYGYTGADVTIVDIASSDVSGSPPIRAFPVPAAAGMAGARLIYDNSALLGFSTDMNSSAGLNWLTLPLTAPGITINNVTYGYPASDFQVLGVDNSVGAGVGYYTNVEEVPADNRFPAHIPRPGRYAGADYSSVQFALDQPVQQFGVFVAQNSNAWGQWPWTNNDSNNSRTPTGRSLWVVVLGQGDTFATAQYVHKSAGNMFAPFIKVSWNGTDAIQSVCVVQDLYVENGAPFGFFDVYTIVNADEQWAIQDLAASNLTPTTVILTWTAPGPGGSTASTYDVRYSTTPISELTWDGATPAAGVPAPQPSGTIQSMTVSGLTAATRYYFAIKTAGIAGGGSVLSNLASAKTVDNVPPAVVADLVAGSALRDCLKIVWTAPGDNGNLGTAARYDIRYSTSLLTEQTWSAATSVLAPPVPKVAGTVQTTHVWGLTPGTTYYLGLKTVDDAGNISPLSNVSICRTLPGPANPKDRRVLTQGDFKYRGYYVVPTGGDFAETHWGQAFTHRYVDGQLRFMTMSFYGNVAGGGHQLMEFAPPATLGGTATYTNHWPDIWTGTGLSNGGIWMGLWFEQAKNRLWTTWAIDYPDDVQASYTKSLAIRTLNNDGTISDGIGPWGLAGVQQRRIYGGVQAIPQWFRDFYQVAPYAVGWGGYSSRMGLGVSMGPTFYAIPEPTTYPTGESSIPTSAFKTIMDHSAATGIFDWYASGQPTSFDRGVRNADVTNQYDAGHWLSPAPDGLGRWTWGDSNWNTGTWIDTPTRHGFVTVPKLASGRAWYEGSTLHCERQTAEIQVFDPKTLGEVAQGTRASWNTYPSSRWEITNECKSLGLMFGIGGAGARGGPGGATYDPITQRLYVLCIWGTNLNSYILVYDVGPISGDINADDYVNVGDLQQLVAAWGSTSTTPPSSNWDADADLNTDGYINVGDLQLLVAHWGESRG